MNILDFLKGYKTFIAGLITFLSPVLVWLLGVLQDQSFNETLIKMLAIFGVDADQVKVGAYVISAIGILMIVLRKATNTAMFKK